VRPRVRHVVSSLLALLVCVALWLPVRAALLMAVFLHRALWTAYDASLVLMNPFWNPWIHLLLLAGPVLLAIRFIRRPSSPPDKPPQTPGPSQPRRIVSVAMSLVGSFLLALGLLWEPTGPEKQGRVWVDEHRSTWERTDRPYDPNWYGQESGYNYACIYDYCSRFYNMDRLHTVIDANTLSDCDVFVVKVPTARYSAEEVAHI
ncbi:MAG: hypothetical protein GY842_03910, partial [bacterium]|nr:hypothetical protein [bacterium]